MVLRPIFLLLLSAGFVQLAFCQSTPHKSVEPQDWKKVSACGIEFSVPKQVEQLPAKGIDSCVRRFEGPGNSMTLDVGMFSGPSRATGVERDFTEEKLSVDGKAGQLATYRINNPNSAQDRVAALYIALESESSDTGPRVNRSAKLTAMADSEAGIETAKAIFRTVKISASPTKQPKE